MFAPGRSRPEPRIVREYATLDFDSLDGEKVYLFFMLISPHDRPSDHLRALENVSRQLRDDSFCKFLKQSTTSEQILQLLDDADNNQFGT